MGRFQRPGICRVCLGVKEHGDIGMSSGSDRSIICRRRIAGCRGMGHNNDFGHALCDDTPNVNDSYTIIQPVPKCLSSSRSQERCPMYDPNQPDLRIDSNEYDS